MEVLAKTPVCWAMFVCLLGTSQATMIKECNHGWLTVQVGSKQPIICNDIADPLAVTWSIQGSNGSDIFRESCNMTTCDYKDGISVSAVSANSTSLLTILGDQRKYGNMHVTCNDGNNTEYRCNILVESTRSYSDCKFYDDGSMITGYCYMERVFSSNVTVYSCQWTVVFSSDSTSIRWEIPSTLVYTAYEESTLLYYKGICYFSYPRPSINIAVKLDGSTISKEYVNNATNFPPPPDQNSTSASLSVEYDAVNPLLLMCSGRPEPVQSYEWSGLVCAQGNQKQNVCLASTSNLTSQQPLVTCTVTSAHTHYNGSRTAAMFYLQLKYHTLDKTTTASDHMLDKTTTASDHTHDKTIPASDHTLDETTTASDHTLDETTTASDHTFDKTTTASDHTLDKNTTASDHTLDETTAASDSTTESGKYLGTVNGDKSDSLPLGAIGGGVGGAVIIIIIIIVVVVIAICRRRAGRKGYERPQHRLEDMADPYTGLSTPVVVDSTTLESHEDVEGYQNQIAIDMCTYDHPQGEHEKDTYTTLVTRTST